MKKLLLTSVCVLMLAAVTGTAQAQQNRPMMNQSGRGVMMNDRDQWMPGYGWANGMMGSGMMGAGMMGPEMMILMMDTNDDGKLSLEEFQAIHRRMFKALDKNGDGELTTDEIESRWHMDDDGDEGKDNK